MWGGANMKHITLAVLVLTAGLAGAEVSSYRQDLENKRALNEAREALEGARVALEKADKSLDAAQADVRKAKEGIEKVQKLRVELRYER